MKLLRHMRTCPVCRLVNLGFGLWALVFVFIVLSEGW